MTVTGGFTYSSEIAKVASLHILWGQLFQQVVPFQVIERTIRLNHSTYVRKLSSLQGMRESE
jgi:hypothetical protein